MNRILKYLLIVGSLWILPISIFYPQSIPLPPRDSLPSEQNQFELFNGKTINKIYIKVIDISELPIDSDEKYDTSWFYKAANTLHIKTKDWVVREWLLFSEGDKLEAKLLEESERLLRGSGAFIDARIIVKPGSGESVDVYVLAKDRWTLTINLSYSPVNESYLGVKDDNLLGFGHSIDASVTRNSDNNIGMGIRGSYRVNNLAGTYINGGIHVETNKKVSIQSLNFSRPFISNEIEWAGGLGLSRESNKLLYLKNNLSMLLPYKITSYDIWLGKSFPVWFGGEAFSSKSRIIISSRFYKVEHSVKPADSTGINQLFINSMLYLVKGGIINRRYYKDYFIDGFGHTEDVPIGGIFDVTFGTDKREQTDRIYSAVKFILSQRIEDFGYTSLLVELGAFKNGTHLEQSVYNINLLYHSILIKSGNWKQRILFSGDYLLGFRRFQGEQIYLNEKTGLRGISAIELFGAKRAVINIESRIFSPYSIWGFAFGANAFMDLGLISSEKRILTTSRLYQGYGFGIRISNESFARAHIEIGAVYNPILPSKSTGSWSIVLSTNFLIGIRNFEFSAPYVFGFKEN